MDIIDFTDLLDELKTTIKAFNSINYNVSNFDESSLLVKLLQQHSLKLTKQIEKAYQVEHLNNCLNDE